MSCVFDVRETARRLARSGKHLEALSLDMSDPQTLAWCGLYEEALRQDDMDPAVAHFCAVASGQLSHVNLSTMRRARSIFGETYLAQLSKGDIERALSLSWWMSRGFREHLRTLAGRPSLLFPIVKSSANNALVEANWARAKDDCRRHATAIGRAFTRSGMSAPRVKGDEWMSFSAVTCEPSSIVWDGPKVSVVMTAKDVGEFVENAVRSILVQGWKNLELIIVEDGSSDNTKNILLGLAGEDRRIRLIENPYCIGTYPSRNKAIATARGDYITFHDADDWAHPDRIAKMMLRMVADDLDAASAKWFRMKRGGMVVSPYVWPLVRWNPSSIMVKKKVMDLVGPMDEVETGADSEYWSRILLTISSRNAKNFSLISGIGASRANSLTEAEETGLRTGSPAALQRERYRKDWLLRHAKASRRKDII